MVIEKKNLAIKKLPKKQANTYWEVYLQGKQNNLFFKKKRKKLKIEMLRLKKEKKKKRKRNECLLSLWLSITEMFDLIT